VTRDEVRFVLARVGSAWGRKPATSAVLDEWCRALAGFDVAVGHAAVDRLVTQGAPGPNLAQFVAVVRAMAPHRDDEPEPVVWTGPTERGRQLAADAVAKAWEGAGRRHPSSSQRGGPA
jgi:hypothetical protein